MMKESAIAGGAKYALMNESFIVRCNDVERSKTGTADAGFEEMPVRVSIQGYGGERQD